jgi:exopolysaccharide biosynthesis polyprenyl glycosylphosphotransferase
MKQIQQRNNGMRGGQDAAVRIFDETSFKRTLSLERRRCERTGVPFALLQLNVENLLDCITVGKLGEIATTLGAAMRETDITGWFRYSSVIGIILTTISETERYALESVIIERTKRILASHLDKQQVDAVEISFHVFPEDTHNGNGEPGKGVRTFYAEGERRTPKTGLSSRIKRAIDVAGSLAALIPLSPVFAAIAILIKATSEGPVFFRQKRVGQYGKEFTFLKFRSMYVNNDPAVHREYVQNLIQKKATEASGTYKIKNDPRVTSIGRFLRKTSLDEIPQFINVLKGEMSLVGPRPPIPYEFESYSLWHRRRILEARPGITGEWQVHGRSRTTFDEMVRMDLHYIRHQSLWLDLKILIKTPFAVFSGDGAF